MGITTIRPATLADAIEQAIQRLMTDPTDVPTAAEIEAAAEDVSTPHPLTVGEAADLLGVSTHTLRYYEQEGLLGPSRDANGHRRFDNHALAHAAIMTRLRLSGMPIAAMKELALLLDQPNSAAACRDLLTAHRDDLRHRIAELQLCLAITDYKITKTGHYFKENQ